MESDISAIFPPCSGASNSLPFNWVVETLTKIKRKEVDTSAAVGSTMIANTDFPLSSIFPPSNFSHAWNWVVETLADIKAVDAAALEGVVIAHVPDFMSNSGGSVKERIALKCLEEWLGPQLPCPPLPPCIPESLLASGSAHQIDPNRSAVEVLLVLLDKTIKSGNQVNDGAELSKHDLHQFILKKRATLPKNSVHLLKDSIIEDSRAISFSKDEVLMPRVDQIAPSTEECEKTKTWKLNIQDDSVLLQKHISASTAIDNSNKILAGRSSGSREYAPDLESKEFELPNRISTNPASKNGMGILQEDPYEYGQKSPQPPQRDGGEPELLKQISDSLVANSGKEIQQEDPSGSGERSHQRNDKELHLLKQISAVPAGNICKELLQTHCSGFEQKSPNQNDIPKLLQNFSSAQANGSDKEIFQENPSGSGLQSLSLQQNGKFQSPEQIPVMQGAVDGNKILHEYPFGSEQQSDQQNTSQGGFRKLSRKTTGNTVCNSAHVLEPSVRPLPPRNEEREVNASGSSVDPLLWKSMVADGKLNMPKAPSDVDGCRDPSFIIDQKHKIFPDEKHQRTGISFNQDFMNGVGIESGLCLKCDRRGSLLVCSGSGCLVAVHDRCIGSLAVFDEKGHFFCPSCSYAQASLAYYKAKKKYSQAKKALASFMGKDSVRRQQERLSHPAILRNRSPIRLVENMDCHGQCRKYQENTKTPSHHKQKQSTIHHNIDNLPGRAETSQSVKRIEVSCDAGESEDMEKPVDELEGVMHRQTNAAVVLDNERMPCSSVYLDIEVTPLTELKNGTVDGHQRSEMMKHQKTLTDKGMREGCQNVGDKQIGEAKAALDDSDLACKETATTSGIKEIYNVHQENLKCETVSVKTCLQTQVKDVTEQNMGNFHNEKTASPVTTAKHAKRELNLQLNNEIADGCRITRAVKKQLTEATSRAGTANLRCEQGETSGIRESHLSQVNIKRQITPDKFSEIQNQKHQEQATHVEHDTHNPPYQPVVAPLTNVGNGRKKRPHTAISQNQHPHLSSKKQIGRPSICNDSKGQNESNYESNSSRSRHYWRPEEEKVLKDAMQKVSLDNGNISWIKIWETIKHICSEARQPGDVKDKWRNIRMKEAREREKG